MNTKTPWTVREIAGHNEQGFPPNLRVIENAQGQYIAEIFTKRADGKAHENAKLIAAAPELLAALTKCLSWAETHQRYNRVGDAGPLAQDIAQARAALAAAK